MCGNFCENFLTIATHYDLDGQMRPKYSEAQSELQSHGKSLLNLI